MPRACVCRGLSRQQRCGHGTAAGSSDESIWAFALERGYVVVTRDEDFQRFSVARGFAPKVVWIRRGNASTDTLVELLRLSADQIAAFVEDLEAAFLPLGRR